MTNRILNANEVAERQSKIIESWDLRAKDAYLNLVSALGNECVCGQSFTQCVFTHCNNHGVCKEDSNCIAFQIHDLFSYFEATQNLVKSIERKRKLSNKKREVDMYMTGETKNKITELLTGEYLELAENRKVLEGATPEQKEAYKTLMIDGINDGLNDLEEKIVSYVNPNNEFPGTHVDYLFNKDGSDK